MNPLALISPSATISSLEWKCSAVIVPLALIFPDDVTCVNGFESTPVKLLPSP